MEGENKTQQEEKTTFDGDLAKMRAKTEELKSTLQEAQNDLQTIQMNYVMEQIPSLCTLYMMYVAE